MSKNFTQKLMVLIEDTETLDRQAKLRVFERFFESELALQQERKYIDFTDLALIQSRAGGILAQEPVNSELSIESRLRGGDYMRIACIVQSLVEFLRSKGFLSHLIGFRKSHKTTESFEFCHHIPKDLDSSCRICGKEIVPVMWDLNPYKST